MRRQQIRRELPARNIKRQYSGDGAHRKGYTPPAFDPAREVNDVGAALDFNRLRARRRQHRWHISGPSNDKGVSSPAAGGSVCGRSVASSATEKNSSSGLMGLVGLLGLMSQGNLVGRLNLTNPRFY